MHKIEDAIPLRGQNDKRKYLGIYLFLGLGLFAYAIWLIVKVDDAYKHPLTKGKIEQSTSIDFPWVAVCWSTSDVMGTPLRALLVDSINAVTPFTAVQVSSLWEGNLNCDIYQPVDQKITTKNINAGSAVMTTYWASVNLTDTASNHASTLYFIPPNTELTNNNLFNIMQTVDSVNIVPNWVTVINWSVNKYINVKGHETISYSVSSELNQELNPVDRHNMASTLVNNLDPGQPDFPLFFYCDSGVIYQTQQCDGVPDCADGTDELKATCDLRALHFGRIKLSTFTIQVTEEYVVFGWEDFFASLSSGWTLITIVMAVLFPEEVERYLKWRLNKNDNAANPSSPKSPVEPESKDNMNST